MVIGDFRRLNSVSVADRYPIPYIRYFSHNLEGTNTFSVIDLVRAYHQRFIHQAVRGLELVFTYLDDLLVASKSIDEHQDHLRQVFGRLREYCLVINVSKSVFGQQEVRFLGHTVSKSGIAPLAIRVQAIVDFKLPQRVCQLKRFLSMGFLTTSRFCHIPKSKNC